VIKFSRLPLIPVFIRRSIYDPPEPFWILKTSRLKSPLSIPQIRIQTPGYPARRLIALPAPVISFKYFHSCQRLRPRALFWLTAWILTFIHTAHLKFLDRFQQPVLQITLKKKNHIKILLICDNSVTTQNVWFFSRDF